MENLKYNSLLKKPMSLLTISEKINSEQKLERILKEHQLGKISKKSAIEALKLTKQEYEEKVKNYKERNGFEDIELEIQRLDTSSTYFKEYSDLIIKYNLFGRDLTRGIRRILEKLNGDGIGKIEGLFRKAKEYSDKSRLENLLDDVLYQKAKYAVEKIRDYNVVFNNLPRLLLDKIIDDIIPENNKKYYGISKQKTRLQEEYKEERRQLMGKEDAPHSFKQYFLNQQDMFANDYNKLKKLIKDCPTIENYVKATNRMIFGYSFNDLSQDEKDCIYTYWKFSGYTLLKSHTIKKYNLRSANVLQNVLDEEDGWVKVKREGEIPQLA